MESFWQHLGKKISDLTGSLRGNSRQHDAVNEGIALVLLDVAFIDNEFENREFQAIVESLKELLALDTAAVMEIIKEARDIRINREIDLDAIGIFLAAHLSTEIRHRILKAVDDVLFSDNRLHPFETALRSRYQSILFPKN